MVLYLRLEYDEKSHHLLFIMEGANASLDPICFLETPDGKVYVLIYVLFILRRNRILINSHLKYALLVTTLV